MLLSADFEQAQAAYGDPEGSVGMKFVSRSSLRDRAFLVKAFSNAACRSTLIADRARLAAVRRLTGQGRKNNTSQHWILTFLDDLSGLIQRDSAIWRRTTRQPASQALWASDDGGAENSSHVVIVSVTVVGVEGELVTIGSESDALSLLEKIWLMGKLLEDQVMCDVTFESPSPAVDEPPLQLEAQLTRSIVFLFEHLVSLWPVEVACEGYVDWWWSFTAFSSKSSSIDKPYRVFKSLLDVVQLWALRENQAHPSTLDVLQHNHSYPQWCLQHSVLQPNPTSIASMLSTLHATPESRKPLDSYLILCDVAMHLISVLPLSELLRSPQMTKAEALDRCQSCCVATQSLFGVATAITVRVLLHQPEAAAKLKNISSYSMCICRMSLLHDAYFPSGDIDASTRDNSLLPRSEIAASVRDFYQAAGL